MVKNGTAYGRETRQMVLSITKCVDEIKGDIKYLTNHYSKRLPHWATIIISGLLSLSVGLIVRGIYI